MYKKTKRRRDYQDICLQTKIKAKILGSQLENKIAVVLIIELGCLGELRSRTLVSG